jgi:hypothetical protein
MRTITAEQLEILLAWLPLQPDTNGNGMCFNKETLDIAAGRINDFLQKDPVEVPSHD